MSHINLLLERNRAFARTGAHIGLTPIARQRVFVLTCLDARVDPAAFLGLEPGDAMVIRNAGGRVTPRVIDDVAFISYMGEKRSLDGLLFEVAVIHHTQCGTGRLADEGFRKGFAERTGIDEAALADEAVIDPAVTVRTDVERLLSSDRVSPRITVSGHVYDVETGLVSTVLAAASPHLRMQSRPA